MQKTVRLNMNQPLDLMEQVEAAARTEHVTLTAFVRQALQRELERREKGENNERVQGVDNRG